VPHPVDDITEPINVRLYICQEWTKDKVALGQAWPMGDRTINGCPILQGCARITIDRILDKKYNKIYIEYPIAEDRPKLGHNKGSQVAWRKRFIKLDHQLSSDDEDDCESSPTHDDHSPSPNRDHSPPHPEPSPPRRQRSPSIPPRPTPSSSAPRKETPPPPPPPSSSAPGK